MELVCGIAGGDAARESKLTPAEEQELAEGLAWAVAMARQLREEADSLDMVVDRARRHAIERRTRLRSL